jgi:uncharacterized protein YecA (UPF0149 family)
MGLLHIPVSTKTCCSVVRLKYPDARDIVGVATESGLQNQGRSEDAIYLDASHWTKEMEDIARADQEKLGILKSAKQFAEEVQEFPEAPVRLNVKNPRNKPCPCGSGKKYKHCCLKKLQ